MAFNEGVILGTVSLNLTGSGNTSIGSTSNTGTIAIGNTNSAAVNLVGPFNANINGTNNTAINSAANSGTIAIGNSNSGAITVTTGSGNFSLVGGGHTVNLANDAAINTVNLGSGTSGSITTIKAGTGGMTLSTGTTGNLAINTGTTGVLTLGTTQTGNVTIGNTTGTTSIQFGSGSALSTYVTTSNFTPVLSFGGGTTGITYGTQTGKYIQIGNSILFTIEIVLTSKGSSSGAARITGLPQTVNTNAAVSVNYGLITFTGDQIGPVAVGGTNQVFLYNCSSGNAVVELADTNFANTTTLRVSGIYEI